MNGKTILAGALVALAACGSSETNDKGDAGSGAGAPEKTVTATGKVVEAPSFAPIADAKVCLEKPLASPKQCVTTGPDGTYAFAGLPADTEIVASADAGESYYRTLGVAFSSGDLVADFAVAKRAIANVLAGAAGATPDPSKGHVTVELDGPKAADGGTTGMAGATFAISPWNGAAVYVSESSMPDPKLTETSASGLGLAFNIDPAEDVIVTVTPPAGVTCTPYLGKPGAPPNVFHVPVQADAITMAAFDCK